jgi:hypothetical protein
MGLIVLVLAACSGGVVGSTTTTSSTIQPVGTTASTPTTATTFAPTTTGSPTTEAIPEVPACTRETAVDGLGTRPGVYLLCWAHPAWTEIGPPGHLFFRDGVSTAEEAIVEWLKGPTDEEAAAGYDGPTLTQYEWLTESLTLRREGSQLFMEVSEWKPIFETSTSSTSFVFFWTLYGTVFSDPTVEEFSLVIMGDSCPSIGESDLCYPISRHDYLALFRSIP